MIQVKQLVEDLQVATRELLDENEWIDDETKRFVMEKIDAMTVLTGFPHWYTNVSALDRFYDKVRVSSFHC
jgi:predicted metalloendopeptidase